MSAANRPSAASGLHAAYSAPPTAEALATRLAMPLSSICKLDSNESPYGAPPAALAALATLGDPAAGPRGAGRYPDPQASALRDALARYAGVPASQIVAGNGSDELIHLLCGLLLAPGDEVVVCEPTFAVYALAARQHGAAVASVTRGRDFALPPEALLDAIGAQTRMVFLCSPNNPTGDLLPRATLDAILARAAQLHAAAGVGPVVVLDEAYYEMGALAGDAAMWTAAPLVTAGARLVVLRTFSKLFGLAGLRVGYALCPGDIAAGLRARKQPYNVGVAGQLAACAALEEIAWLRARARLLLDARVALARALAGLGLRVYPSAANFVLAELATSPTAPQQRDTLWQALLDAGIMVRRLTGYGLDATLRISVGTPAENARLIATLRVALPQACDDSETQREDGTP